MESSTERPPEMEIAAFRQALQRIRDEYHRLVAAQDLSLPLPQRRLRLAHQLLRFLEELNVISGFVYTDARGLHLSDNLAQDPVEPVLLLCIYLVIARVYARCASEPLEVNTASTHPTDLAVQAALPRIRDQCNRVLTEHDYAVFNRGAAERMIQQIQELTMEFQQITGLEYNNEGILRTAFEQQNALRAIDVALHKPIFQIYRFLNCGWMYAIAFVQIQEDLLNPGEDRVEGVTNLDAARAAEAVAGMPRKKAEDIKNSNKAATSTEPEFQNSCMICCRDWEDEDEIINPLKMKSLLFLEYNHQFWRKYSCFL